MLIDLLMGWRNIWRNPRRTLLTLLAIAFACTLLVFMLSFQFGSYETMINASVKIHTGHLQVQAAGYHKKRDIRRVVDDPAAVVKALSEVKNIKAHTFRASAFVLVSSKKRTYGVMVTGIEPEKEARVSTVKNLVRKGKYLSENGNGGIPGALLGKMLAENLQVRPGDELTLLGQGRDGSIAAAVVKVDGIFSSGIDELDRSTIQIPLHDFQEIFFMQGAVHSIVFMCSSLGEVPEVKAQIRPRVADEELKYPVVVLDWDELMPGLKQGIQVDLISGIIMYLLLVIVVAFSILNTFLMAIFERTREFGVLLAIGTTPRRLTRMVLMESTFITAIGILLGIIAGVIITYYFQINGLYFAGAEELLGQFGISGRIYPKLSLLSVFTGPLAVFVITILSALYPALKVRQFKPVEALAHV